MSGEVIKTINKIFVRFVWRDVDGEEPDDIFWLTAQIIDWDSKGRKRRAYGETSIMDLAYDWVEDYGDLNKARNMAIRLAKVNATGKDLIKRGYVPEIVLVRDVTKRTINPLTEDNPLAVLALSALD